MKLIQSFIFLWIIKDEQPVPLSQLHIGEPNSGFSIVVNSPQTLAGLHINKLEQLIHTFTSMESSSTYPGSKVEDRHIDGGNLHTPKKLNAWIKKDSSIKTLTKDYKNLN